MGVIFYVLVYLFLYVSCIGQLHDNAQTLSSIIKKCLLVVDNVGVRNWSKHSNLVKSIIPLLLFHLPDFHLTIEDMYYFFHGIQLFIINSLHFINAGKRTLS